MVLILHLYAQQTIHTASICLHTENGCLCLTQKQYLEVHSDIASLINYTVTIFTSHAFLVNPRILFSNSQFIATYTCLYIAHLFLIGLHATKLESAFLLRIP